MGQRVRSEQGKPSSPRSDYVIEATDIVKRFGHVQALSGASLQVRPGEVLALVGDNGAGKSTLTKIICGALTPDSGRLAFWGETTTVTSIRHAQELGVETVYQDLALAPDLSVAENMFLGREEKRGVGLDEATMENGLLIGRAERCLEFTRDCRTGYQFMLFGLSVDALPGAPFADVASAMGEISKHVVARATLSGRLDLTP